MSDEEKRRLRHIAETALRFFADATEETVEDEGRRRRGGLEEEPNGSLTAPEATIFFSYWRRISMSRSALEKVLSLGERKFEASEKLSSVESAVGGSRGKVEKGSSMKSYRPNFEMQKRRYSLRLSLLRLRKDKPLPDQTIVSNSQPWIENPRSLADAEAISDSVSDPWTAGL